jgi:hypothetical protein
MRGLIVPCVLYKWKAFALVSSSPATSLQRKDYKTTYLQYSACSCQPLCLHSSSSHREWVASPTCCACPSTSCAMCATASQSSSAAHAAAAAAAQAPAMSGALCATAEQQCSATTLHLAQAAPTRSTSGSWSSSSTTTEAASGHGQQHYTSAEDSTEASTQLQALRCEGAYTPCGCQPAGGKQQPRPSCVQLL